MLSCNDTATTEFYTDVHTLSLHGALPICVVTQRKVLQALPRRVRFVAGLEDHPVVRRLAAHRVGVFGITVSMNAWQRQPPKSLCFSRSEEHTSELQSRLPISYAVFCLTKNK